MSGEDADFTAYLAARWPSLVRTLVLLGLPQPVAEEACLTGLARCREAWRDVRELDDVDAEVHRAVLDACHRGEVEPVALAVPEDPTEAERLRALLERQLAGLTTELREAIVLDRVAGLDRAQVADVLDLPEEFYLETVDLIFQQAQLANGTYKHRGRLVDPGAIRNTALLTVEGGRDDICSLGQTAAAHDLCSSLRPHLKRHHLQANVGHYGIFNGKKWECEVYPVVRNMILAME